MYQVQFLAGPGFGSVPKGDGGYACNTTVCYSYKSPATNQLYLRLQDLLNKSAKKLGIPLYYKPDGLIGANTVRIATAVSDKLGTSARQLYTAVVFEGSGGGTKEVFAQRADVVVPELAMFVGETIGPTTSTVVDPYPTGTNVPTGVNIPTANVNPATSMPYGDQTAWPTAGTQVQIPNQPTIQTYPSSYAPPVINVTVPGSSGMPALPSNTGPMIGIAAVILAVGGAIAYAIHAKKNA